MQTYSEVQGSEQISQSWSKFVTNDRTILSNFSGKTEPTDMVHEDHVGMIYYNIDSKKSYQLTNVFQNPDGTIGATWTELWDNNLNRTNAYTYTNRGTITSAINFNSQVAFGVYRVSLVNWDGCSNQPSSGASTGVLINNHGGTTLRTQVYVDTNNKMFRRTYTGSTWTAWVTTYDSSSLTKTSQLTNDSNYVTVSDLTTESLSGKLANTFVYASSVNTSSTSTGSPPGWNTGKYIPAVNAGGVIEVGRIIDFHTSSSETLDYAVRLDVGATAPETAGGGTLTLTGDFKVSSTISSTGNITSTGGDVIASSDERLKEDIEVITDAVEKVKQIRGVTFKRKKNSKSEPRQTGVIAQELQKVLPEAVVEMKDEESGEDYLYVAYGNTVGLLIEAIKEQQKTIEELQKHIGMPVKKASKPRAKRG